MKITDVSLTLFAWDDIPPTQYGQHSRFAGSSALGLLRIATDDGVEGHAFLGSASNSAAIDGQGADHASQAHADGPQSAASRGAGRRSLEAPAPGRRAHHRRRRRGALGPFGQGGRPADPSPARHLSRSGAGLCQLRRARRRPAPTPRRRSSSRRTAGRPTRSIRRRAGARTSRSARRCATPSATSPSCSIRPGPTIIRRRCASAAPSRRWTSTGTKTRSPTRTSTIT